MNIKYSTIKSGVKTALLCFSFLLYALSSAAQALVTQPMTGTPAAGAYYSNSSIVLSPGFSFTAGAGQSLSLFILSPDCQPLTNNFSAGQNYIVTSTPRVAGFNPAATGYTSCDVAQTVQYFDGLGRPVQTVQVKASPLGMDIVQPIAYDPLSREPLKYLPYAAGTADGSYKTDALQAGAGLINFYNPAGTAAGVTQLPGGIAHINSPYAGTAFEPSPLDRVVEQGGPGDPWQLSTSGVSGSGHTVKIAYGTNAAADVILWTVNSSGTGATGTSNYAAGQLYSTTTTDENGNNAIEYKDKSGDIICKKVQQGSAFLATYYVYNDFNDLSYVIPPIPVSTAYPASFAETDAVFLNFIYGYHYDLRQRLTEKKIPGKGWEYTIYNAIDEAIATQDANQATTNQWTFTKYDPFGRLAYTGVWNNSNTAISRASLQATVNSLSSPLYETRAAGHGYTNVCWPTTWLFTLKVNYYDDYTAPGNPYTPWVAGTLTTPTGLPTITLTQVLNADGTRPTLWSANYYDSLGRLVQTSKQHYLGGAANYSTSNFNVITNTYDFANEITASTTFHLTAANTSAVTLGDAKNYFYDHAGRKTQTWEAITVGSNPSPNGILLSQANYNEIGQLITKHLYSPTGAAFLQNTGYAYNERGWLTKINDPTIAPTATQLFSEQLNYNNTQYGAAAQYNGNIAEQVYNAGISGQQHVTYSYDNLNRLTAGNSSTGFSETGISYDQMGNILTLTRAGTGNGTLAYTYANGNQLSSISGFKAGSYVYDNNGNMTTDGARAATINYNMLNLPQTVTATGVNIAYTYDADGKKLRKVSGSTSTDYIDGIQYTNGSIAFLQTQEGRAINTGGTSYNYEFTLTDHLGNNRVTFDIVNGKIGEDDYYPFGLNVHRQVNGTNLYLYNRKELQPEITEYDYGARFYDPVAVHWDTIDPDVEDGQESTSPYCYVFDNPVRNTDPDGRYPDDGDDDPPGVLSVAGNFVKGVGQSAWGTITGAAHAIIHPIETIKGLAELGPTTPGAAFGVGRNLFNAASKTVDDFNNGNADVKSNIAGNVAGDIGQLFIGTGEVKAATEGVKIADEVGKVAKVAGETDQIGKANKAASTLEVGSHAGESIVARGKGRNFTTTERAKINEIGGTTGCHTCGVKTPGTKSGNFVPDHQPPSGLVPDGTPQNLYPQCSNCSVRQGGQVSAVKKTGQ